MGPKWVYGVVTFLGLDEKERTVLMQEQTCAGGSCFGVLSVCPSLWSGFSVIPSNFCFRIVCLCQIFTCELDRLLRDSFVCY